MKIKLERKHTTQHISLIIENDSDHEVRVDAVDGSVVWQGHRMPLDFPGFTRNFHAKEVFPLDITYPLNEAIQRAFPKLPDGENLDISIVVLATDQVENGGPGHEATFSARFEGGKVTF